MSAADWTPRKIFLTRGKGVHREKLASFELALREAGIQHLNLVMVSSILPPQCRFLSREKGAARLRPGQVVPVVMARMSSNEAGRLVGAGVGVAVPKDRDHYGYLSEHHAGGTSAREMEDYVEDMAAEMLATTYGIAFDPDASWDEKREIWSIDGRIVRSRSVVRTARVDARGRWTTVIAAAVLLL